ncbi:MAG: S8 family serine peptidase, partial [Candidatus Marinimicrobia bacterium]|nr:S8 family serine peptidase [Candidatus Neomarinimicrobiota bacterium]
MKTIFKIQIVLVVAVITAFSQPQLFTNNAPTDVVQLDARASAYEFVPGDILVKFKDDVRPALAKSNGIQRIGVASVDAILTKYSVNEAEKLFKNAKREKSRQILKTFTGKEFEKPSLHNIYKLKLKSELNMYEAIEALKQDENVEYAEPNYIFSIVEDQPQSDVLSEEDVNKLFEKHLSNVMNAEALDVVVPNDPLYPLQWWISATQVDAVWDTTTGDSSQLIGIIDTGIDWHHPDLKNKIWTNPDEIPDNGIDDDQNGFIDDVRGWDWINHDNDPMDDNSHGTHVAGIAAAEANNGIGIAGVNWQAKVIPIKVFQSSGRGDAATITQGIIYAANKGATVINMSFGSYARSLTMENALANAYATAVLVAAAGNDGLCIGPGPCPDKRLGAPMCPGAFSFVLGVEANNEISGVSGFKADFSNYDQDGPVFSDYPDLLNYELKAPGSGIISCVQGGNYREFSGTSMATPIVAGAVLLYRTLRPSESQELLFGNFINSINQNIDLEAALNIIPIPKLDIVSYELADTLDGDHDGRADAGETIELKITARNTWGQADNVKVGIEFGEFEDTTIAVIQTPEAIVGSISAYATRFNTIPLKIKLGPNITDGRAIVFNLKTWYNDHQGESCQQIAINVENGVELKGIISNDMTLYPDKHYIITDNIAIPLGVTLTIKPGTILKIGEGKSMIVAGNVYAIGTRDSLITFTKRDNGIGWRSIKTENSSSFQAAYSVFEYLKGDGATYGDILINSQLQKVENCLFKNNDFYWGISNSKNIEKSCFYNNISYYYIVGSSGGNLANNNIIDNFIDAFYLQTGGALSINQLGPYPL